MKNSKWLIVFTLIAFASCDPADNRFTVINNSDDNINVYYSCDSTMSDLDLFRSGYYENGQDSMYIESDNHIKNDTIRCYAKRLGKRAWIDYVKSCDNEMLFVFFLTDSILDNYSDNDIKSNKMYVRKDKYSLNDLKELDWKIVYSLPEQN